MNLILVGVRGAGKTAVGSVLSKRLGVSFIDLDQLIEERAGSSIRDIFFQSGEAEFRAKEAEALLELRGVLNTVVATGGGVVLGEKNRETLSRLGKIIWLQVSPEIAVKRMGSSGDRPPLSNLSPLEEACQTFADRGRLYEEIADVSISTDSLSLKEICDELEQYWNPL